ncbi:jg4412 [Pararge aegeria aegeria]|uniref:Jg4412 protein n=1 Tax=Pararge aegeria aegeria TaxID=348720 RepID=A0A8S4RLZ0_9NEOP|nr:jg4412 [Pararge aegeria aegeria]
MLGVSLHDQIRNEEIRKTRVSREAEEALSGAHNSENQWTLGSQVAGNATSHRCRVAGSRWTQAVQECCIWIKSTV